MSKKISILIPVRNWDVSLLINALACEIHRYGLAPHIEILVGDDQSAPLYQTHLRKDIAQHGCIHYHTAKDQLGWMQMCCFLKQLARGHYLLLLACDVLPDRPNFLCTYLRAIEAGHQVVCGGISYHHRILKDHCYDFSWYKGVHTESIPVAARKQQPWRYFFTGNILLHRAVYTHTPIDSRFGGYGYEDTEWGIRIHRTIGITHIDNPCSHLGLLKKEVVLNRMRRSIPNYLALRNLHPAAFWQTPVAPVATRLSFLPSSVLRTTDSFLQTLYSLSPWNPLTLFLFQVDKAVLMARYLRQYQVN